MKPEILLSRLEIVPRLYLCCFILTFFIYHMLFSNAFSQTQIVSLNSHTFRNNRCFSDSILYATVRINGLISDKKISYVQRDQNILIDAETFSAIVSGQYYPFWNNNGLMVQYGKIISFAATHFQQGFVACKKVDMVPPVEVINNVVLAPPGFLAQAVNGNVDFAKAENVLDISTSTSKQIGTIVPQAKNLVDALIAENYIVQQGAINRANPIEFFAAGYTPDCQGNNAKYPYLIIQIPPIPGAPFIWTFPAIFNVRSDEALVIIGKTPPECIYYSYRSYLANRYYEENPPQRKKVFASLGDTQNAYNVTEGRKNTQVYDRFIMIISTADKKIEQSLRQAALLSGIAEDDIYVDVIPGDAVHFGLDNKADLLSFVHRVSLFNNSDDEYQYVNNPNLEILRITPREQVVPDFIPQPVLRSRGSGSTEFHLNEGFEQLRQAIVTKYNAEYDIIQLSTSVWGTEWGLEGLEAIKVGVNTLGETRDTIYLLTESFEFNQDDIVVVFGVNHTKTKKAVYCNVNCYGAEYFNGFGGIDNSDYQGTASEYLNDSPQADSFYVWKFARQPVDKYTFVVPADENNDYSGIDYGDSAKIGFRAYIEPATKVGPSPEEIILDQAILLRPKNTNVHEQATTNSSFLSFYVFPNPFNSQIEIQLSLTEHSEVYVSVYNIQGQLVKELFSTDDFSGNMKIVWTSVDFSEKPVSSGVYLINAVYKNRESKKQDRICAKVLLIR